jgi:hypothetical protein
MIARISTLIVLAILAACCGGAGSNQGAAADEGPAPEAPQALDAGSAAEPVDPLGSWENGSCGEREYLRRVNFLASGNFTALDSVAPCPPKAQCVWSGIIRWSGAWEVEGDVIELSIKQTGEKMPEVLPREFVVLGRDPLSIGERVGDLVCPYRRVD